MALKCRDCGMEIFRASRTGPNPRRCQECKETFKKASSSRSYQKNKDRIRVRASVPEKKARKREYMAQWYSANKENQILKGKERYQQNREFYLKKQAEYRTTVGKANVAAAERKRRFNVSVTEIEMIRQEQGDRCAICQTDTPGGRGGWHFDHDHSFSKKDSRGHRGLLCHNCNLGLGHFQDNEDILSKAIAYLQKFKFKIRAV